MRIICLIAVVLCSLLGFANQPARAQQPPAHAPQIHAVLLSGDELSADLKFLMELSGPQGAKNWKEFKELLDSIFEGADTSKPAILDILLSAAGSEIRAHFPLQVIPGKPLGQKFLQNVDGLGIKSKKLTTGFYQLGGGETPLASSSFNGFLRILIAPINYASIATKRSALPANLGDPTKPKAVVALLAKKYDLGLLLKNDKADEASIKARRTDFKKVKDELLAGLKQRSGTTAEDFAVEKALLEHNLNEAERFVAESSEMFLGWTTDAPKKEARLDFELDAIAKSELETSAKLLGEKPGMFSGVPRSEHAILSTRIHFPLDELRKSGALGGVPLLRARADARIEAEKEKSAEQKAAMKNAAKQWYDMLEAGVKAGVFDGMIEVSQATSEKMNLLAAVKVPDGNAMKGILELIPQMNADFKVKLDVEKVGDYAIHAIEVPEKEEDFDLFFGKGVPVYVATGQNAWWVAVGPKSLDQLKSAIDAAAKPNEALANNFVTFFSRLSPWIETLDARRARLDAIPSEKKLTEAELKDKKDRAAHRKLALDAFKAGKDTIETKIDAKNGHVSGSTRFDEGILRFIGSELADFSNKTLK